MSTTLDATNDFSLKWTGWPSVRTPRTAYCAEMKWSELAQEIRPPQPMPAEGEVALNAWNIGGFREGYRNSHAHPYATGITCDYDSDATNEMRERGNPGVTACVLKAYSR
jgi:hypothetical protein